MDATSIGTLCAGLMEQLSDEFPEDAFVRTTALIVEVDRPDSGATEIRVACTEDRAWAAEAFVDRGLWTLENREDAEREA